MIKVIREQLGMSQAEFGGKLNRTQGSISHYEQGRRPIDSDFADDVIELCRENNLNHVDYNYIFGGNSKQAANA